MSQDKSVRCAHYTESTQYTLNYSQQWHKVFVHCFMTGGSGGGSLHLQGLEPAGGLSLPANICPLPLQVRSHSVVIGMAAIKSLPVLTSFHAIAELTPARKSLSAPCATDASCAVTTSPNMPAVT